MFHLSSKQFKWQDNVSFQKRKQTNCIRIDVVQFRSNTGPSLVYKKPIEINKETNNLDQSFIFL